VRLLELRTRVRPDSGAGERRDALLLSMPTKMDLSLPLGFYGGTEGSTNSAATSLRLPTILVWFDLDCGPTKHHGEGGQQGLPGRK